jgi:MFS family permease
MSRHDSYGWVVLAAAFAIISLSIGTLFTLGVFLEPIERGTGWSRWSLSAVSLINWIVMGAGGVVAGYLSDRFGTRAVVLAGGVLLGLGLALSSQAGALWQFQLTFGILVAAGVSAFYVPLTVVAIKWFDHRRGLAAALVSAGNGFGILVLSPLARWLIGQFEWRWALLLLGDLVWLLVIPTALLIRNPPGVEVPVLSGGSGSAPAAADAPGARVVARTPALGRTAGLEVWRAWPFWAIALTHFACCAAHSGPIFHMVSHAIDSGVGKMAAATVLGASGFSSIFGRIGTGMVADRIGAKPTLITALSLQAALIFLYVFAVDLPTLYGLGLAFGVAYGGAMPLYALVTREYFGERVMGTAYGAVFFISCIGMGLGSFTGGAIHDLLGSYLWLFLGSAMVGAMAVVLAATLRPPVATRHGPPLPRIA